MPAPSTPANHWLRWHHGTTTDPKWRVVAARASKAAGQPIRVSTVLAVWAVILEAASQATPRGTLAGWCAEDVAMALDEDEAVVEAVHAAMQGKVLDGATLTGWAARQPQREREDTTAAERKRAQREREAAAAGEVTEPPPGHATDGNVTPCHTTSRHVTHRGEEIREDLSVGEIPASEQIPPSASAGARDEFDAGGRLIDRPPPDLAGALADAAGLPPGLAGQACKAMRTAGLAQVNPSHPDLLHALAQGVTPDQLADVVREFPAKPLGYVLRTAIGRMQDAGRPPARASPAAGLSLADQALAEMRAARGNHPHA